MKRTLTVVVMASIVASVQSQVTVTLQPGPAAGKDAYIVSCVPCGFHNTNYGTRGEIDAISWTNSGNLSNARGLIEFDLTAIPAGAKVIDARLSLYYNPNAINFGHSGQNNTFIKRITSAWDENTVTWANQPSTTDLNQAMLHASTFSSEDYPDVQVRALVQDMIDNPAQSHGFMLQVETESPSRSLIFASSDYADPTKWPKLDVTYIIAEDTCVAMQPGSAGKDARVLSCIPCGYYNMNWGNDVQLDAVAWTNGGSPSDVRAFLEFDLSAIPPNSVVTSARLSLYFRVGTTSVPQSGRNNTVLQRVATGWDEHTITWPTQPATLIDDQVFIGQRTPADPDLENINVTALVSDMVKNPTLNHGFRLALEDESPNASMILSSSDWTDPASRPKLEVCYATCGDVQITVGQEICSGDTLEFGTQLITSAGTYVEAFPTLRGCDSTVTLELEVNPSYAVSLDDTMCSGDIYQLGTQTITSPGTYSEIFTSVLGCDSTVNLNLALREVDTSVIQSGVALTAITSNATYQWVDCNDNNTVISGATNQTYVATANGSYAVIVTIDGCSDTSACYSVTGLGISSLDQSGLSIFPNPAERFVVIQVGPGIFEGELVLYNVVGSELQRFEVSDSDKLVIERHGLSSGVYFVRLTGKEKVAVRSFEFN